MTYNISLKQHLHQVLHDESLADEVIETVCQWLENIQASGAIRHRTVSYEQLIQSTLALNLPEEVVRKLPHTKWILSPQVTEADPLTKDEIPF